MKSQNKVLVFINIYITFFHIYFKFMKMYRNLACCTVIEILFIAFNL